MYLFEMIIKLFNFILDLFFGLSLNDFTVKAI
jgi:hypothetical protein